MKRQDSALDVRQDNEHETPGWCVRQDDVLERQNGALNVRQDDEHGISG